MYDKPLAVKVFLSLLVGLVVGAGVYAIAFFIAFFPIGNNTHIDYYLGEGGVLFLWFICGPILAIVGGLFAAFKAFMRLTE